MPKGYERQVRFYSETTLMHEEGWQDFSSGHINGPVYISIDKDVLNPASAATNWDQGSLSLQELEKLLAVILQKEQVVGIDICGECSTTLNLLKKNGKPSWIAGQTKNWLSGHPPAFNRISFFLLL